MSHLDETDPANRLETCFAPRCEEQPVIYGRRYGANPIQVFPVCDRHASSYPIVKPEDLETFLEEKDVENGDVELDRTDLENLYGEESGTDA